jgi:hypothetical protein
MTRVLSVMVQGVSPDFGAVVVAEMGVEHRRGRWPQDVVVAAARQTTAVPRSRIRPSCRPSRSTTLALRSTQWCRTCPAVRAGCATATDPHVNDRCRARRHERRRNPSRATSRCHRIRGSGRPARWKIGEIFAVRRDRIERGKRTQPL